MAQRRTTDAYPRPATVPPEKESACAELEPKRTPSTNKPPTKGIVVNTSVPNQPTTPPNHRLEVIAADQTWDEYESTRYFFARMRGETPDLEPVGLGADAFGGAA